MAKRWTKEEDALLLKLRQEGLSSKELAFHIKRSAGAIRMRLSALGADLVSKPWSSQDKALAWQLKEAGHSTKYIARKLSRTTAAITSFLSRDEANHYSNSIPLENSS